MSAMEPVHSVAKRPQTFQNSPVGGQMNRAGEVTATAFAAGQAARIQARFVMAMQYPRDLDVVREAILYECKRPEFAEDAIYSVPRGQKRITGLSIRFAEVAVRCMRNIDSETFAIAEDDEMRVVRQQVTDYESNIAYSIDIPIHKTVERKQLRQGQTAIRSRMNSNQEIVYLVEATEEDLLMKQNALVSKALRTNVLRVLPGDIQEEARRTCDATLLDRDRKDPEEARRKILKSFELLRVPITELKDYFGHEMKIMTEMELAEARELHNGIRDGEITWNEAYGEKKKLRETAGTKPRKRTRGDATLAKLHEQNSDAVETVPVSDIRSIVGGVADAGQQTEPDSGSEISNASSGANPDLSRDQAIERLQKEMLDLNDGNRSDAEMTLSEATAGKIQTFAEMAEKLTPDYVIIIDRYLAAVRDEDK